MPRNKLRGGERTTKPSSAVSGLSDTADKEVDSFILTKAELINSIELVDNSYCKSLLIQFDSTMKGTTVADRISFMENEQRRADVGERPPLAPLAEIPVPFSQGQRQKHSWGKSPETPGRSVGLFSPESEYEQYHRDENDAEKFDLMNITIIVYGLSGIMCEKVASKKKKGKFGNNKNTGKGMNGKGYSGSTISSTEASATDEAAFLEHQSAPTTAVVSFRKNAISSQHSLETFLPSIPLHLPNSSSGAMFRYAASWPSGQTTLVKDDAAIERSSFNLTRCMRQEAFVPSAGVGSNYVHETLELRINMSRGTELIRLGCASLVITGEEEGEMQMNIPTKPIQQKSKNLNRNRIKAKTKSKSNKYGFFSSDLTRRYYLGENATLRVGIKVIPQDVLNSTEEREKQENDLKDMLRAERNNLRPPMRDMRDENHPGRFDLSALKFAIPNLQHFAPQTTGRPQTPPQSIFSNVFCGLGGTMLCAPGSHTRGSNRPDIPLEIIETTNHFNHMGIDSIISSVSESTDGSDYSDGEIDAPINNFHMSAFH